MQVNDNVNISNLMLVGNQTANRNVNDSQQEKSFASFLQPAVKQSSDVTTDQVGTEKNVQVKNDDRTVVSDSQDTAKVTNKPVEQKNDAGEKKEQDVPTSEQVEEVVDNQVVVQDDSLKEDEEAVLAMISTLLQTIVEQLDIPVEALEQKLNELGMEVQDLLEQSGVQELFLAIRDAEPSDLLIDEQLNQEYTEFVQNIQEIVEEIPVDMAMVENFVVEQDVESLLKNEKTMPMIQNEDAVVDETENVENVNQNVEEPIVIVQKNTDDADTNGDALKEKHSDSRVQQVVKENDLQHTERVEHSESVNNQIVQNLQEAVEQVEGVTVFEQTPEEARNIVNQIVEQIKVNMSQDETSMQMQLYPEHLGKIQINVVSKDGVMTARIVAETEAAKQAIEGGLLSLKESMEGQNLKVDAIEVMVSTAMFEQGERENENYDQKSNSRSGGKLDLEAEEEEAEEEAELAKMQASGSSVSYMA